jgi:hypothetical protein
VILRFPLFEVNGRPPIFGLDRAPSVAQHDRMLFAEDVSRELLQGRRSATWVRRRFAPEFKRRLGRSPYWFESDALAWMVSRRNAP